jgi:hypothetical protein
MALVSDDRHSKVIVSSKRQLELLPVARRWLAGRAQPQRQPGWLDGRFDHREQFGGERVQVNLPRGDGWRLLDRAGCVVTAR